MPITQADLERAKAIARSFGATRLILFGSALRDPLRARDLDLAVDGVEGWDVWALAAALEDDLSIPLDLVPLELDNAFTHRIEAQGKELLGHGDPQDGDPARTR